LAVLVTTAASVCSATDLNRTQFEKDLAALTRHPHRLAGYGSDERIAEMAQRVARAQVAANAEYQDAADIFRDTTADVLDYLRDTEHIEDGPGSLAASKYVQERLTAIRDRLPQDQQDQLLILTQEFDVVQPTTTECRLEIGGKDYPLYAARPNAIVARVTPSQGLSGVLIYAGRGELEDYGRRAPEDAIVVLDYDGDWQTAFAFGAKAVVILGDANANEPQKYSVDVPANLPVFFTPAGSGVDALATQADPPTATVFAACQWKKLRGRNVVAVLQGTDPQMGKAATEDQAIVLAAPLDSMSEVPLLSPGARDAANTAALLQLADYLTGNRPRRDVVLCFFDGQFTNHTGARAFYTAIRRPMSEDIKNSDKAAKTTSLKEFEQSNLDEYEFLDNAIQLLRQDNVFEPDVADLVERRDDLRADMVLPGYMKIGPALSGTLFIVVTIIFAALAVVLAALRSRPQFATSSLAMFNNLVWALSVLLVLGLVYGLAIDPKLFGEDRRGRTRTSEYERIRLDAVTKRIDGLESSHRATMDLLKDEARLLDSVVLEKLRPVRVAVADIEHQIKLLKLDLKDLGTQLQAVEAQLAGSATESIKAQQQELEGKLSAGRQTLEGLQASLEVERDKRDELAIRDLLWNTCQRIVRKKIGRDVILYEPTKEEREKGKKGRAELWSESLTDSSNEARQEANRTKFKERLQYGLWDRSDDTWAADPNQSARSGVFEELKKRVIANCQERKRELLLRAVDIAQAKDLNEVLGVDRSALALHISLNLGDERPQWTFIHGDKSSSLGDDTTGAYRDNAFKAAEGIAEALGPKVGHFDTRAIGIRYNNELFGGPGIDSGGIARIFAVRNLAAMTVMDHLARQGQVTDTLSALDAGMLFDQVQEVAPFVWALGNEDKHLTGTSNLGARARFFEVLWENDRLKGVKISRASAGQAMLQLAVPDALLAVYGHAGWGNMNTPPGFVGTINSMSDSLGFCEFGPMDTEDTHWGYFNVAADFDGAGRGIVRYVCNEKTVQTAALELFKVRSMSVVNYGFASAGMTTPMRSIETSTIPADRKLLCEAGQVLTLYAPFSTTGIKLFNTSAFVILNNKPTREDHPGWGIPLRSVQDEFSHPITLALSARDLGILNEYRLQLLRDSRINQESLQVLNGQARDLLDDAVNAGIEGAGLLHYAGDTAASAALSRRAYAPLRSVMDDLVTAVVLLLLLAVPFAYSLERLVIGTPHIYRQIGWFILFFLTTFGILYVVNPAFRIASTPIIIFLAFGVMMLSGMVIMVLIRKLQSEVKVMQGLGQTVHSTDVSRVSTMSAAVMMGISTMRRRPLRTFLTAATVVLLTFTILTFASFGTTYDNSRTYKGPLRHMPARIMVHHQFWNNIDVGVLEVLQGHLSDEATVVPRYWVAPTAYTAKLAATGGRSLDKLLADASTRRVVSVSAGIGMDLDDVVKQKALHDLFEPGAKRELLETNGIFLTRAVAEELQLTEDDIGQAVLRLAGQELLFGGFVSDQLATFESLEGSNILPVDFEVTAGSEGLKQQESTPDEGLKETPEIESGQFAVFGMDRVVIFAANVATKMEGTMRALTIYPNDPDDVEPLADSIARITGLPTYYGKEGEVYRTIFASVTTSAGIKGLLVPVVLGGMIIFATMLGSVTDREREIYTFSSLGLAPAHVASLFFAEASVYAIVGGMGGYLLGQTVARVLSWVSTFANVSVPTMNYSSSNAIMTIMIVMGTVLISTIYPAIKASRSANPGIQRSWRIPKPTGDLYDLIFPFTVSAYDITGVVSFLKEHFDNYTDTSLGIMATSESHIFRQTGSDQIGITAAMALAPFDLGVNQRFVLVSQPSEIEGIDEVRILINRHTGTRGDWTRANRVFINDLRKQLLIWRSLTNEVMDQYREKTLQAWDQLAVEQVDETTIGDMA